MTLTEEVLGYHAQLLDSEAAQAWHHARGISDEAIRKFKLGVIDQPLTDEAKPYAGWFTIPYLTTTGKVIQLKVRNPREGAKPKYMKVGDDFPLEEPKSHLYNAMAAMPTLHRSDVYIVEGEYDAVVAWQAGLKAVAAPGATNWYPAWSFLFESADVILAFDGDEAGKKGSAHLEQILGKAHVNVDVRELPDGVDITDLWLAGGRGAVRDTLV